MGHDEEQQYKQLEALNKLLREYSSSQFEIIKHLKMALTIVAACFTLIICSMVFGFFYYESQFDTARSVTESTTTEMKTEGENSNINSVTNGDMYNDAAVHNN